ncbi:unnamed protein product [Coffea canephora]|uniref:BHLH domain-containing protein n=1 Tax=Coffea canephora TaxID=49390 RepID=A0A068TZA8_COFCA|nr:unnamed protein product [Coffea canephora]
MAKNSAKLAFLECERPPYEIPHQNHPFCRIFLNFITNWEISPCNYPKHTVKTKSDKMMHLGTAYYSYISPNSFNQEPSEALEYGVSSPFEKGFSGTPVRAQDHILAERKRRQKLSSHIAALSAVVPDLKKLDKASVLGGAVKHIKQLDKRVKFFEKEEKKRNQLEELLASAMKKPRPNNDNSSSSAENVSNNSSCDHHSSSSVEVQVTSSGGDMLIKIECKNHEGILLGFSSLMKRIHLNITSSSFMQFGHGMLFIGAVAQVDEKFCVTAEFLANSIRQALLKLF